MDEILENVSRETIIEAFNFTNLKIQKSTENRFLIIYNLVGIGFDHRVKNTLCIGKYSIVLTTDKYILTYITINNCLNFSDF
jgi:hypothetical protein